MCFFGRLYKNLRFARSAGLVFHDTEYLAAQFTSQITYVSSIQVPLNRS